MLAAGHAKYNDGSDHSREALAMLGRIDSWSKVGIVGIGFSDRLTRYIHVLFIYLCHSCLSSVIEIY